MIKTAAAASSLVFVLGACGTTGNSEAPLTLAATETGADIGDQATPTSEASPDEPVLTQVVTLDDITSAAANLTEPRPVTVTLTRTSYESLSDDDEPSLLTTIESATTDPSSTVTHIVIDETEWGAFIQEMIATELGNRSKSANNEDEN